MKKRKPLYYLPGLETLEGRIAPTVGPLISQSFDTTPVGTLPTGWSQYQNTGSSPVFGVENTKSLNGTQGLSATASIAWAAAQAWANQPEGPNVEVSAAVYTNNSIPVLLLARGSQLNTGNASFYALSVKTGVEVKLQRIQAGVTTTLAVLDSSYLINQWVQATFNVSGTTLRAQIVRLDTNQYLSQTGTWQAAPTWALTVNDSAITTGNNVGLGRPGSYAGTWYVDNFLVYTAAGDESPPQVSLPTPTVPLSGVTTLAPTVTDDMGVTHVVYYVDGALRDTETISPFTWDFDTTTVTNGTHTLTIDAYDQAGNLGKTKVTVNVQNANTLPVVTVPADYNHTQVAELVYSSSQLNTVGDALLNSSVSLAVADTPLISQQIAAVAPNTTQLLYTNVSTVYQSSLEAWLNYARSQGINEEDAFYHVTTPTPFTGNSPSSQPVDWFWGVFTGGSQLADVTTASHGSTKPTSFGNGSVGQSIYLGYLELFREIDLVLPVSGAYGWSGVLEYASAVDAHGNPTQWTRITTLTDTTAGYTHSGQITFDPPANWKPAVVHGSDPMYYVRIRTVTPGRAPAATSILGADYVNANGTNSGVIPVFDYAADTNHLGYLTAAEYANRAPGDNAWFAYQSRSFFSSYGQMRFATNPSNPQFQNWAVQYMGQLLQSTPTADGLFIDNSNTTPTLSTTSVQESLATYGADYASLLNKIATALSPKIVMPNTYSAQVIQQTNSYFEEVALKPLAQTYQQFMTLAGEIASRSQSRTPAPLAVLDIDATGGSETHPRTQMAGLAEYYLLANPTRTLIDPFGGDDPSSDLSQHWFNALTFNLGQPVGSLSLLTQGQDPSNTALTYQIYQRAYTNALVLFKPLSTNSSGVVGTIANNTATTVQLGGSYRELSADGSLGSVITSISLRNGEGAILVKA